MLLRDATIQLRDGRTLAYREWGKPDGTPVFLLHGPARVARVQSLWRTFVRIFMRFAAPEVLTNPELAADRRPVFELVEVLRRAPTTAPGAP